VYAAFSEPMVGNTPGAAVPRLCKVGGTAVLIATPVAVGRAASCPGRLTIASVSNLLWDICNQGVTAIPGLHCVRRAIRRSAGLANPVKSRRSDLPIYLTSTTIVIFGSFGVSIATAESWVKRKPV